MFKTDRIAAFALEYVCLLLLDLAELFWRSSVQRKALSLSIIIHYYPLRGMELLRTTR
jgi:hypothetical protein